MNRGTGQLDELGRLTAALCDGEITPDEAARLEYLANRSSQARRFFLRYVQLHGELYWENAAGADRDPLARLESFFSTSCAGDELAGDAPGAKIPSPAKTWAKRPSGQLVAMATVASLVVVALWGVASFRRVFRERQQQQGPVVVARLARTFQANWPDGRAILTGTGFRAGRELDLRQGLAEIRFRSGARAILEGPARFDVERPDGGFLHSGKLTASVPGEAARLTISTPSATVVDRGTEFGIAVDENGQTEVHVFAGTVGVLPSSTSTGGGTWHEVHAAGAVAVPPPGSGDPPQISQIAIDSSRFVRTFPAPGSVAGFRALVARHPNLIHHYTFEGVTELEKRKDKKGGLDLIEVVMHGGSDGGRLDYSSMGVDATTNVIRPHRAARGGNAIGVGLQSEGEFHPPPALTIELLLNFEGLASLAEGEISTAVATRRDQRNCGFFVAVAGKGGLVHLMDGDAPWVEARLQFIPGDWYYVAGTFRVDGGETTVSTYVANLSRGDSRLRQVVQDEMATGAPAASRLGIGKGFARNIAHAYPWIGGLDEVAIYDAVLTRETLEEHLKMLAARGD